MKAKKLKKIVSLLLAVMMVSTMLPMSAFAAVTVPENYMEDIEASADPKLGTLTVALSASDELRAGVNPTYYANPAYFAAINPTLGSTQVTVGPEEPVPGTELNGLGQAKLNVEKLSSIYVPKAGTVIHKGDGTTATTTETLNNQVLEGVEKDKIFYVGAKVVIDDLDEADKKFNGLSQATIVLRYDPNYVEYVGDKTDSPAFANLMWTMGANIFILQTANYKDYHSAAALTAPGPAVTFDGDKNGTPEDAVAILQVKASDAYYLSEKATWDVVFPFKAKAKTPANQPTKIKVFTGSYKTGTDAAIEDGGLCATFDVGSTDLENGGAKPIYHQDNSAYISGFNLVDDDKTGATCQRINTKNVAIEILGTDPEGKANATINPATGQEVSIPLANCSWASDAGDSDFKLVDSDGSDVNPQPTFKFIPAVAATESTPAQDAKIQFSAVGLGGTYTLKIQDSALMNKAGNAAVGADNSWTTSGGTIKVRKNMDGTVTISGTETYNQELTATYDADGSNVQPGEAAAVKYQWYRGSTAITNPNTDHPEKYKLVKEDVGQTIKVEVTHDSYFGNVSDTTSGTIGKIALSTPANDSITPPGVTVDKADTESKRSVAGKYTFTGDEGLVPGDKVQVNYTAKYDSIASKKPGNAEGDITFGALVTDDATNSPDHAAYSFTPSGTITFNKGTVSETGYNLAVAIDATGESATDVKLKDGTTEYTSYPGGTAKTLTVDIPEYLKISTVSASGTALTATKKSDNTIEIEAATPAEGAEAEDVTITIKLEKKIQTLTKANFTFENSKVYDTTKTLTGGKITANATGDNVYNDQAVGVEITGEFVESAAGTKSVKITGITKTGAGADYYNLGDDLAVGQPITVTTGITPAELEGATVTVEYTASGEPTIAGLIEALNKANVVPTMAGAPALGTVQSLLTAPLDEDDVLAWINTKTELENDAPTSRTLTYAADGTITDEDGAAATPNKGDTIAPAEGVTVTAITIPDGATGYSFDPATFVITVGEDASAGAAIEVTVDGAASPVTMTITPGAAVKGHDIKNWDNGTTLTWDIKGLLKTDSTLPNFTLPADESDPTAKVWPTVTASVKYTKKTNPVPTGILVSYDTKGYGKSAVESDNADADGKLASVPTVETVKGAYFEGWALKPGNAQTIYDPKNEDAKAFTEDTTLYALINGYLSGDGAGHAMPADKITKEQMATMLVIASSDYDVNADYGTPSFDDVTTGWASKFIARAEALDFISGHDGVFEPKKNITRNEAARMIADAFGVEIDPTETTTVVSDFDEVPTWAKKYVAALCNRGVIKGKGDNKWHGEETIRRDEAAVMINVFLGMTDEKTEAIKNDNTLNYKFTDIKAGEWNYAPIIFASLAAPADLYSYEYTMPEKLADKTPETEETTGSEEATPAE